ncbi:MAG: arabinose efflux permease family protein, partial [Nocardioidaceae bacterium]|nr:arabinose efflux permease family protein [Nocardioidaceae bacterium]
MTLNDDQAAAATAAEGTAEQKRQVRKAALASTVGTTIEWYDFFLYNTAAALVFPALFFPDSSVYAGRLESFATYAVGFAARPVGAMIFGHWGDRIGRKATLIVTLVMMGIASTLVGLMPGANDIGKAAPLLLVLLRLLQGIAVGGEWSGSVLLSMEWGDQKRRGFMASLPQLGVAFGLILGTGFLYLLSAAMSDDSFQSYGWRIPFLFSIVLMGIGLYIRIQILETPMFAKRVKEKAISRLPSLEVWKAHWKPILLSALARLSEQAPFYVITTFTLTYLTEEQGYSKSFALAGILSAAGLELIAVP